MKDKLFWIAAIGALIFFDVDAYRNDKPSIIGLVEWVTGKATIASKEVTG